jgi:hypothetical protein
MAAFEVVAVSPCGESELEGCVEFERVDAAASGATEASSSVDFLRGDVLSLVVGDAFLSTEPSFCVVFVACEVGV